MEDNVAKSGDSLKKIPFNKSKDMTKETEYFTKPGAKLKSFGKTQTRRRLPVKYLG